jgi:NAD(P)H dehydrogenase (quinone)
VLLRIAVTGANGRLGGRVVELLAAEEGHHVVAVCRGELRPDLRSSRVSVAVADYTDLAALRAALHEVDTLVFVSSDGEAAQLLLHHRNVVQAAADGGVPHVVVLSSLDADVTSPFCYAVTNGYTEQILRDTGCALSIARASIYTEFFMHWLVQARASGEIRVPAADGRVSLVSRTDVARCLAALALAAPTGRHHDITGPQSLTLTDIAALTERAWGTPVRYVELTRSDHCVEMAGAGEDPWWLYAFSTMFDSVREQRWAAVSDEVRMIIGHPPASLLDVLAEHHV